MSALINLSIDLWNYYKWPNFLLMNVSSVSQKGQLRNVRFLSISCQFRAAKEVHLILEEKKGDHFEVSLYNGSF